MFEQSGGVGGTWVYTDNVGLDDHGLPIHSSMYKNLKTNLPKEVMAFPDFPFSKQEKSFLHHSEVQEYLQQYCQHFSLEQFIMFNTMVSRVERSQDKWKVTSKCLQTSQETTEIYDSVMVCNGHYSVPVIPDIPGIDQYVGQTIHSHNYREPQHFAGETVIILGGGASGTDISIELSDHAKTVFLSHNNPPLPTVLPDNLHQVSGVKACTGANTFLLHDDSTIEASVILLATGYHYTFPFLTPSCDVSVESRRVSPLFKHLININHPSMCFIGIPVQICPFPQFDLQTRFFMKTLSGQVKLPSQEMMMKDLRDEEEWKRSELKMPAKHFHKMGVLQWKYNKDIAALGQLEPISDAVENLYNAVHQRRRQVLPYYKNDTYQLEGSEGYLGKLYDHETKQMSTIHSQK